jgi:uncharacterized membrane protein (TIGR02234 family)
MSARRELRLAVLLCLGGSLLTLVAVRHAWATYETSDLTIRAVRTRVAGTRVAGAAQALAVVGLAGTAAIAATRRAGRLVVGALLALAGIAVVLDVARLLGDLSRRLGAYSGLTGLHIVSQEQYAASRPHWVWPVLTMVGGLLLAAGGLLVALRGRRWAALSSSYEVPAARDPRAEPSDKAAWDALDAGHDPTA